MMSNNHSHHRHHHFAEAIFHSRHHRPEQKPAVLANTQDLHNSSGILFVHASDFVHNVAKGEISGPIAACPMGSIDVTANDYVFNGSPSRRELKSLRRHIKETADVNRGASKGRTAARQTRVGSQTR
ncbi:hypothetical protein DL89DRAFT_109336 [Linderina pennispora]|uniref:Uncharacterized protein n=1 Tax=Linderina pennispora TaxID=61395 RepID=A0A1Y1WF76_9FUNG|nr:uncharacterized protein DL89DRAFT_109336 [Linderina pennispora]ORX72159.1 hypothetical protein DL89DRAFT_109336 [Linderina pennispora]